MSQKPKGSGDALESRQKSSSTPGGSLAVKSGPGVSRASRLPLDQLMSDLLRASVGSSAQGISNQDLDKHVAELIAKEAREQQERYERRGLGEFLIEPSDSKPRTVANKRFLRNIISSATSQNQRVQERSQKSRDKESSNSSYSSHSRDKDEKHRHGRHNDDYRSSSSHRRRRSRSPDSSAPSKRRNHRSRSP